MHNKNCWRRVPQLTSVMDAYEVAIKNNVQVISDGGMRYSGDIAKSLAAGELRCLEAYLQGLKKVLVK